MLKDLFFNKLPPPLKKVLLNAGFNKTMDLLLHFPLRHEHWDNIHSIADFVGGETYVVEGEIISGNMVPARGRRHFLVVLKTADGRKLTLRFFQVGGGLLHSMTPGRQLRARGVVRLSRSGWEMAHPKLQSAHTERETAAVYPAVKGVRADKWRQLIRHAFVHADLSPTLPATDNWTLRRALEVMHAPESADEASENEQLATHRLQFEELLAHLIILRRRYHYRGGHAPVVEPPQGWGDAFVAALPFELTASQQRAIADILADCGQHRPMRRLLQGDVGSGKTVVAATACLAAVKSGHTAAFMVPTEILAEQHYQSLSSMFAPARIQCELLTGAVKGKRRQEAISRLQFGISHVVVGTHALFQESVLLPKLALTVIDEQHRFGVEQRRAFTDKGVGAHQLMMSATPIPRTLAMSLFADMDISTLNEMPAGRKPVQTRLLDGARRKEILSRAADHIRGGGRVYWVCPRVEESDDDGLRDVQTLAAEAEAVHPEIGVRVLHGRMKGAEKNAIMDDFRAGKCGLLAATTVIEVGVDVPQADVMVIERADRMGLSQLHQLRGRVGRGDGGGNCLLLFQRPLSQRARERLRVMKNNTDGFEIARHDLLMRGPGEWLGNRQSGLPALRIARLDDDELIKAAKEKAEEMLKHDKRACVRHARRWLGGVSWRVRE